MSHLYNPYPTDPQSSAQGRYGHSSTQAQSDPQRTSHPNPGLSYRSAPPGLSPNTPSPFALPLPAFMAAQSWPAKEEEPKRSTDLRSGRAREESLHLPRSYAITPAFQEHRKAVAESSDGSLNWPPTYKSTNEDNAFKYYTSATSSIFPGGGESRTSAASSTFSGGCESRFMTIGERKPHEQFISGLSDYEFPVRETATAQPKLNQPKYTLESASNIILHFGLEKKDLEQLASYPEDQITPQNLPFILRQIRQQKTKNPMGTVKAMLYPEPKPTTSVSDTDLRGHMGEMFHQDYRPRGILKASKVIDYGHMSQFSAGSGEEVEMASGAHSVGNSTLLDSSGREAKEMSSVPSLGSPFSFKISSKSLPTKNPPKEFSPPPKARVPLTKPKTDKDTRILPGVSKSLSLKEPEPSQPKSSKHCLSDTLSPAVASGRLGVVLYDTLKDIHQPLKQVSKVPEPKQKQQQQQVKRKVKKQKVKKQKVKKQQPAAQVDTASGVPAPAQMYDYAAITPGTYPHSCSLCDEECFSVKEWINHQNTELHLENCKLLRTRFPEWDGELLTSLSASDVYTRSSTTSTSQSCKKRRDSSSGSRSRSHSPQRYRCSGSRRDQERSRHRSRSRSYSPRQSSRRTRRSRTRSRSQSPLYPSTTSLYRSRSRSYERRSSSRRRDDGGSSTNRSRSKERGSSEKLPAEKPSKEAADGKRKTGLTMGEMLEENLLLKRITCVEMKSIFSPGFASNNRRVLHITNLPKYEDGSYTERDVANLLIPFGFQHEDENLHNIYVIPQKRMALAVLPTAEMAVNIIRASVKDCFKLCGCQLFVKILENKISCPMEFFQTLMLWMNKTTKFNHAKKIVFIKNVSPSEVRDLKEVLKKIGNVMNYVPLLNKVFVEFYWMHEADRLGVWYSLLRQPPQHFIYRLGTPRNNGTAQRPDKPKRALPDLSLRVAEADLPMISVIPLGYSPPFYVTMTTFPFIFPTICPWFNIPAYEDPFALFIPSCYSTIMMTGLPEDGYCQLDVARMVWSLLHQRNIQSLFYRVMVLPLQRRAFIYLNTHESGWEFSQLHIAKPFCVQDKPVNIYFLNDEMDPGLTEETMYRQLMKLSNAHVPPLSGLDQRLLVVQVSEVSLELIQAVMKEVTSVGRLAGFLPLGNRICIEMLEPSDRMKVMEAKLGSLTAPHLWKKVIRVDTVQSLHQHQLHSLGVIVDLDEDLYWMDLDHNAQDYNSSSSSSTKPAAANIAPNSGSATETSKDVEMVEEGSSGATEADSDVANSDNMTRTKKLPEGHTPSKRRPAVLTISKHCHVLRTPPMERPEGPASSEIFPEGPTPSDKHPEGVKASMEHPEGLLAGLKLSKKDLEGQTPSEKCLEVPTPSEEHLEGPKLTEEHPEGSTLSKECSEGLALSKEWCDVLISSGKHLEGPTQSEVHLEGMIPSQKCPEEPAPSEEQSKGLTQSKDLPQGPTPSEELTQSQRLSEELPQCPTPSEELPQGPIPTENLSRGPTLSMEKSGWSTQSEDCLEGPTTSKQPKTEIEEFPPMGEDTINVILTAIQQHKQAKRVKVPMGFTADVRFSNRGDLRFGRTSEGESEEKQDETQTISEATKPDSITNKEGANEVHCMFLDSAGSETIQDTEKVGRRRSTRGNKEEKITSQTTSSKEEPKYKVSKSVEDDVAPEEAVMVMRATRGRRGRPAKRDIPTRGPAAAKECEEGKETSPKAEEMAVTVEEVAYKVTTFVEDEDAPDGPPVSGPKRKRGRPRNVKATSKNAISKKAKVEIEEEPNYHMIDSVEKVAEEKEISVDPGTAENCSTPEDDYDKQKITESVCEEDKKKPTYQIVDIKGSTEGEVEQKDYTNLTEDKNHESSTWRSAHGSQSSSIEEYRSNEIEITAFEAKELLSLDEVSADKAPEKREKDSSERKEEGGQEERRNQREGPRRKEVEKDQVNTQELLTLDKVGADDAPEQPEAEGPEPKEELLIYNKGKDRPISDSGQLLNPLKSETFAAVDKENDDNYRHNNDITEESHLIMLDEAGEDEEAVDLGRKEGNEARDEETQTKESQSDESTSFSSKQQIDTAEAEASGQSDKGAPAFLEEGWCEVKVVNERRKELVGPEAKRCRSQSPDVPADFTLLTYSPGNPLGQEFVVPQAGFFCNICSIFYVNENTAKEAHCSSRRHFDNLKKYYLKLKKTPSEASSPTSSNVSSDEV